MTGSGGGDDVLLSIVPRQKAVSHMIDTSIRGLFGGSLWDGAAKGQHNMIDTELYLLPTFLNMIQLSGYSSTDVELLFSWVFGDTFFQIQNSHHGITNRLVGWASFSKCVFESMKSRNKKGNISLGIHS